MKNKTIMKAGVGILSAAVLLGAASIAFAQTTATTSAKMTLSERKAAATTRAAAKAALNQSTLVQKSDAAIDKRIADLNDLTARVGDMKNVSDAERASLTSTITAEITDMNNLKAKIAADTDMTSLKTDAQSISTDNRVYMLAVPKIRIVAAADRATTLINMFDALAPKLQARITEAQTAGKDVTALTTADADFTAKIADATNLAGSIQTGIQTLAPDQGNKTVMASNEAALKAARANLKLIEVDLAAARKDVKTITGAVKGVGASANASATVSATTTTQ